jgi:subtilase family serine protease
VIAVPVCKTAQAHHASCFAMRLKKVPRGTAGARPRATHAKAVSVGPKGGYTPTALTTAYGVNASASAGSGITIAIVDAFNNPSIISDLNTFDAQYGIAAETATSFKVLNQNGATSPLPANNTGWAVEEALDVEAARAMCRKCTIVLYEANSNSNSDLYAAVNKAAAQGADVISNSYGGAESGGGLAAAQAAFNHPGIVITASTGDDGFFSWDHINEGGSSAGGPNFPSSLSTVVAVGGTTLSLNPDNTRAVETVWNENGPKDAQGNFSQRAWGAAGGGCSSLVNATPWQHAVATWNSTGCGAFRSTSDVAADADPFTGMDVFTQFGLGGWGTIGGTSLSAPLIGGMWGAAGGAGGATNPSISLYGHRRSSSTAFYDVAAGGNGLCGGATPQGCESFWGGNPNVVNGAIVDCAFGATGTAVLTTTSECNAIPGYDGPTGVGTPKSLSVFTAMKPTAVIASPGTVTHGVSKTFDGSGSTDPFPGGSISDYTWNWGDHTAASHGAKPSHKYAAAGTYTVKLTVTDNYGYSGVTTRSVTVH